MWSSSVVAVPQPTRPSLPSLSFSIRQRPVRATNDGPGGGGTFERTKKRPGRERRFRSRWWKELEEGGGGGREARWREATHSLQSTTIREWTAASSSCVPSTHSPPPFFFFVASRRRKRSKKTEAAREKGGRCLGGSLSLSLSLPPSIGRSLCRWVVVMVVDWCGAAWVCCCMVEVEGNE